MIVDSRGDILRADVEALVNTVNCVGVMGRGIALQFKKEFPENFETYQQVCRRKALHPGRMLVVPLNQLQSPRYIINFPTKRHWKGKSRLADIDRGLEALIEEVAQRRIASIAIPPLGCGLGGLDWNDVRPRIERAFANVPDVRVLLYGPAGAPNAKKMSRSKTPPHMTVGRAALLGLMHRYLAAVMEPSVTLLEIHKLMYFMQEAGEPLQLRYVKGIYGPYSENLRHVLTRIEGHFITGYGDAEDDPTRRIDANAAAIKSAETFLHKHPDTRKRFGRVAELIEGFETSYGMELLATVHWVARHEQSANADEAAAMVHAWNDRKKMFSNAHIQIAWEVLERERWLEDSSTV